MPFEAFLHLARKGFAAFITFKNMSVDVQSIISEPQWLCSQWTKQKRREHGERYPEVFVKVAHAA